MATSKSRMEQFAELVKYVQDNASTATKPVAEIVKWLKSQVVATDTITKDGKSQTRLKNIAKIRKEMNELYFDTTAKKNKKSAEKKQKENDDIIAMLDDVLKGVKG